MGQGNTEMCVNCFDKSGTVCSVSKTGAAPYIGIAHKLAGVIRHCLSGSAGTGRTASAPGRTSAAVGRTSIVGRTAVVGRTASIVGRTSAAALRLILTI